MSRRTYSRMNCPYCGQEHSTNGLAQYSHKMKHVREGILVWAYHEKSREMRFVPIDEYNKRWFEYYIAPDLQKYIPGGGLR